MSVNVAASICEHSATSSQHASPTNMRKSMPMIVAAASAQIVIAFLSSNILQHSVKSILQYEAAQCAAAWTTGMQGVHGHNELVQVCMTGGILAPKCARAWGSGGHLCMCMWHQPPSVHVQWACFFFKKKTLTLNPKTQKP